MTRRQLLWRSAVGSVYLNCGRFRLFGGTVEYSRRALDLMERVTVVDMLGLLTMDWARLEAWHRKPEDFGDREYARLKGSGVSAFHPAVQLNSDSPRVGAIAWMTKWNAFLTHHEARFARIDTAADFAKARADRKIGLLQGMQNSDHFERPADVSLFHGLGQRISQLTYNTGNAFAAGCMDRRDNGLTAPGGRIVACLNDAGIAIDVSHTGDRSTMDAIAASRLPVLITHSNCRALRAHPRCKTDEAIRALARRGGVIGITALRRFAGRREPGSLEDVLDHFDHVRSLVGIEHVGIGSDTDLGANTQLAVAGLEHPKRIYDLTEGLIRRGYTDRHIEMILGANFIRSLCAIWDGCSSALPEPGSLPLSTETIGSNSVQ